MRDPQVYTHPGTHLWSVEDNTIAELLLRVVAGNPTEVDNEKLLAVVAAEDPTLDMSEVARVWQRMQSFPYIFELAELRGTLPTLTEQSAPLPTSTPHTMTPTLNTKVQYRGWHVALKDLTNFRVVDKLSPGLFEHFAQIFREHAPAYLQLSLHILAQKRNFIPPPAR